MIFPKDSGERWVAVFSSPPKVLLVANILDVPWMDVKISQTLFAWKEWWCLRVDSAGAKRPIFKANSLLISGMCIFCSDWAGARPCDPASLF